MTDLPTSPEAAAPVLVSALVTACDAQETIVAALDSVLAQAHPPALLELIVADAGSSDGTAALVEQYAATAPVPIRLLQLPRAAAPLAGALPQARGEVVALLDARDAWPANQLALQLAALAQRPELGAVYTELTGPAAAEPPDPPRGKPVARLLREDCVGRSSIALRGGLLAQLGPAPAELARTDRWVLARAACTSEIDWLPIACEAPVAEDEVAPAPRGARIGPLRETLALQRWFLRASTPDASYLSDLAGLWRAFAATARELHAAQGEDPFAELLIVTDAERASARRLLADAHEALARGESLPATALAARAAASDPWCAAARALLNELLAGRPRRMPSDPLAGARRFVTLAFAEELLAEPDLLAAYGAAFDRNADATLAIDASGLVPAIAAERLGTLVHELELDGSTSAHLLAVLGPIDATLRSRLPTRADALLTRAPRGATPSFDDRSIGALRELATRASAA